MKHLTTFLIAAGTFASLLRAEIEEDIPYGIEAVTGLRSAYTYRGLELASSTLDFQLAAEVAVDNQLSVGAGAWICLLYTSPSPRDQRGSRMAASA